MFRTFRQTSHEIPDFIANPAVTGQDYAVWRHLLDRKGGE